MLNSLKEHHKNCMVDSKEKYKFDLGVKGLKLSWPVPFLFNFADVVSSV